MTEFTSDPAKGHPAIACRLHYADMVDQDSRTLSESHPKSWERSLGLDEPFGYSEARPSRPETMKATLLKKWLGDGTIDKACDQYTVTANAQPQDVETQNPEPMVAIGGPGTSDSLSM
ncbi:hypothetical protein [Rhodoligotrophos defluvii]|uniref:hypothetical protein n=1 Tax=Rhodoligotrophos defluvii TaxID=2561934 RepID=UPI0010C98D01|nr:hypothetical protein [Rhodoligotrophos defluvii]